MPLRLLLATDIHYPSTTVFVVRRAIELVKPDAVVISGDLSENGRVGEIRRLFEVLRKADKGVRIIAVLGNHDLRRTREGEGVHEKLERIAKHLEGLNVELLDIVSSTELGDYRVVGNVGWYDYSFAPGYPEEYYLNCNPYGYSKEYLKAVCERRPYDCPFPYHRDCIYVDVDSREFARENKERIRREMKGDRIIVVTHHAPLKELLMKQWFFNAYDGQDMSELLDWRVRYFLYGHLHEHSPPRAVVKGVVFVNPYRFQGNLKDYVTNAVLTLV